MLFQPCPPATVLCLQGSSGCIQPVRHYRWPGGLQQQWLDSARSLCVPAAPAPPGALPRVSSTAPEATQGPASPAGGFWHRKLTHRQLSPPKHAKPILCISADPGQERCLKEAAGSSGGGPRKQTAPQRCAFRIRASSPAMKHAERSGEGMRGFGGALAPSTPSLRAAASCLLVRAEERKGTCGF